MSATLVGRRMGLPILGAALLLSGALAVLAFGLGATVVLLVVVGASRALLIAGLGHAPTQRRADRIAGTRLAAGSAPDGGDTT